MKKIHVFLLLCSIGIFSVIATTKQSEPTITYFPPDDTITFSEQQNSLLFQNNIVSWNSRSTTNKRAYLRQDVALLYQNGVFKGLMNQWKSNTKTLEFQEDLSNLQSGMYESISYFYSETHTGKDIRSAASMKYSSLQLECTKKDCHPLPSENETNINDLFTLNDAVQNHWNELLSYYSIDESVFKKIKLTQLYHYNDQPLPTLTKKETDDVINHLWEGLYANYIVELLETNKQQRAHYMPLILFKEDEIQVLYEINGRKEQLIQKIHK